VLRNESVFFILCQLSAFSFKPSASSLQQFVFNLQTFQNGQNLVPVWPQFYNQLLDGEDGEDGEGEKNCHLLTTLRR
jgi:hypothetical protein